ncbi:hypothetical protein DQG23_14895 [Paenibacillus contaminans]|uniref:Uncharacterized protein n=1 Tax=Paenibacillus contaminans TaxID=450362 RepID=A0A329MMD8_9BACL|nr:hypothetical protein DQG23_14895 [Paenibacillus contaminans]
MEILFHANISPVLFTNRTFCLSTVRRGSESLGTPDKHDHEGLIHPAHPRQYLRFGGTADRIFDLNSSPYTLLSKQALSKKRRRHWLQLHENRLLLIEIDVRIYEVLILWTGDNTEEWAYMNDMKRWIDVE